MQEALVDAGVGQVRIAHARRIACGHGLRPQAQLRCPAQCFVTVAIDQQAGSTWLARAQQLERSAGEHQQTALGVGQLTSMSSRVQKLAPGTEQQRRLAWAGMVRPLGTVTLGSVTSAWMSAAVVAVQALVKSVGVSWNRFWKLKGTRRQLKPSSCAKLSSIQLAVTGSMCAVPCHTEASSSGSRNAEQRTQRAAEGGMHKSQLLSES